MRRVFVVEVDILNHPQLSKKYSVALLSGMMALMYTKVLEEYLSEQHDAFSVCRYIDPNHVPLRVKSFNGLLEMKGICPSRERLVTPYEKIP